MTAVHRIACPIPFPLKTVNCYYIADSHPALIDTSVDTPDSFNALSEAITHAGGKVAAIERIILTHAHTDHAGMAGKLGRISGAEVYVHRWDAPKIVYGDRKRTEAHLERFRRFLERAGIPGATADDMTDAFARRLERLVSPIDRLLTLSGGEVFQFDDFELRVIHTPGHSAGSICLLNDASREFFAGDTLLENITPNPVAETNLPPDIDGYRSIQNYLKSLDTLSALGMDVVWPGHGADFRKPRHRISALNRHFQRRKQIVLKKMRREGNDRAPVGGMTLYRLTRGMFPGLMGLELFLGLSEAFAYLQFLESEEQVTGWQENGVWRFELRDL